MNLFYTQPIVIDLSTHKGEKHYIMGLAVTLLKETGKADEVGAYMREAKSGDYDNLIAVTKAYVGDVVEFTKS